MRNSARAIIINKNNEICLIKRNKKDCETYWVLPGGGIEDNETIEQALLREIKEELGFVLDASACKQVLIDKSDKGKSYIFECSNILDKTKPTGEEFLIKDNPDNQYKIEHISLEDICSINIVPENIKLFILANYNVN